MGECCESDAPTLADSADHIADRHPSLGEEHLVEGGIAVHLHERTHLDARLVHVDHEIGNALVLRHVEVGPRNEDRPVRLHGARGPQLLTGDHPLVTVEVRSSGEPRKVGAVSGLAEQLAPAVLTRERGTQQARLDVVAAVLEQRRGCERHRAASGHTDCLDAVELCVH